MNGQAMGPNVKRLLIMRMSVLAVDNAKQSVQPGEDIIGAVVDRILKPGGMGADAKEAWEWVKTAIATMKAAPDCVQACGSREDEDIAAYMVRRAEERKRKQKQA